MKLPGKMMILAGLVAVGACSPTDPAPDPAARDVRTMDTINVPSEFSFEIPRHHLLKVVIVDPLGAPYARASFVVQRPGGDEIFRGATDESGYREIPVPRTESVESVEIVVRALGMHDEPRNFDLQEVETWVDVR